ncbi:MAG TPA: epimerase [Deltaproteobacteria bacterium]|nr:epimerase [Deltaproteobacteria bacterium]
MMRVLITGGAGFVGRRFCKIFLEKGYDVVCVDNLMKECGGKHPQEGWYQFNPLDFHNFVFYQEDCRNFFVQCANEYFDEVYHLAAVVGGRMMIEKNPLAIAEDLSIDSAYWQWAKQNKIPKTIYFSSSAAYPIKLQEKDNFRLLKEDDINFSQTIGVPDLTYGWAKLTGEFLAHLAYERHDLKSVIYRPFSGYGEDQDWSYPVPSLCLRALELQNKQQKLFKVWGSGYQMRDFIHIDDCVRGILITKDKINNGRAINLSTGILTSFVHFSKVVIKLLGYHDPIISGMSEMPEGVFARGGDVALQKELGFSPSINLEEGIGRILLYFKNML